MNSLLAATISTGVCCLLWLKICQISAHKKILTSPQTRKLIHIGTGFIFIFTWGLFPVHNAMSRFCAALIPGIVTLQFSLIGFGVMKDQQTVNSMSRTGDPRELLLGPASYGVIFVVTSIVYWMHSPIGITALSMLFVGDGFAGLIGQEIKTSRLPHNKSKTVGGTLAFIVSSIYMPSLFVVTIICAAVESIPLEDWDNITVFLTCVGSLMLMGWT
ncbi:hypothetical protein PPL_05626 [Heterostelium album PN500]|uniref:phytol kinase n=1 Tax=Heterostelium pallidum (strain ATCC 26659 / Pp 5 / PN500) TaxID=670386 RepID=D3BAP7_HETP5|nr:hypothetical protein PPL_05626 [Heterostelium album PN500]EFA81634.1 hypothetical protein PPL_05626 [Heterostelium album PN500]|eukprot:XP_020433751.1 hypothetical protein PPL_05626 [Heterostelium album PN500]